MTAPDAILREKPRGARPVRRYRCAECGLLLVDDRHGNVARCPAHREAERHAWGHREVNAFFDLRHTAAKHGVPVEVFAETYDRGLSSHVEPGTMAWAAALWLRWGGDYPELRVPETTGALFGRGQR